MPRVLASALLTALLFGCGARTPLDPIDHDAGLDPSSDLDAMVGFDAAGIDTGVPPMFDAGPPDSAVTCSELRVRFSTDLPMLILLIDRSGSMRNLFRMWTPMFPSATRWEVVRELLVGRESLGGLVDRTRARIGLSTYATRPGICPHVRWVPPAFRNSVAIREEMFMVGPRGGTPTAEAIRDATMRVPMHLEGREPVAFLLATDGNPVGCGGASPTADTVAAVEEAYGMGIRTFVVSVGTDTSEEHMQNVANAGAGLGPGDGDATYWRGRSPSHLSSALEEAAARAVSCIGTLSRPILDMSRRCDIAVSFGGETITCDDLVDGFRFPDASHIEFHGAACGAVRMARPLELDAPCDLLGA